VRQILVSLKFVCDQIQHHPSMVIDTISELVFCGGASVSNSLSL
jgi:hypothetical protein